MEDVINRLPQRLVSQYILVLAIYALLTAVMTRPITDGYTFDILLFTTRRQVSQE